MYASILIPIIFDDEHDSAASFRAAQALADEGATFTVLHVMESIPTYVANDISSEILAKSRQEVKTALAKAAEALPNAKTELASGHAGRAILDYAENHDIDCIIIASQLPGFANLLLGSTADRVVRHAKCSVHVIR